MKNLKKLFGLMVASGLAFSFAGNVNAEETPTVVKGNNVEACLKAEGKATCTLTANQTIENAIEVKGNVTLKLEKGVELTLKENIVVTGSLNINGGTIKDIDEDSVNTLIVKPKGSLTTDNVKIISETKTVNKPTQAVIAVYGDKETTDTTTVNIGANTTVEGYAGLIVYPEDSTSTQIAGNQANNVTVNLNGTWKTTSYVIQVQGVIKEGTPVTVNINGGSYTSEHNTALYASGLAKWNVENAKVVGTEAMVIRGGDVTINSGTFTGNGTTSADNALASGVTTNAGWTGASIAVVGEKNSYVGNINLEINDGTFTSENKNALYFDVDQNSKLQSAKINNGTFVSPKDQEALWRDKGNPNKIVYGGTFIGKTSAIDNKSALASNLQSKTVGDVTYVGTPYTINVSGIDLEEQTIENGTIDSINIPASAVSGQPINIADLIKVTANKGLVVKYVVTDKDNKEITVTDGTFTMPDSNVTIAVSIVEPGQDPVIQPSEPTKPTDTDTNKKPAADNTASKNPQTYDAGIMGSLVLVLSSIGTLGYASKKVLSK